MPDLNESHLPEDFLHFVWREQHFSTDHLLTRTGEQVRILFPGTHNHDQGPDFLHARLEIEGLQWQGHVEIHWRSEEWYQHGHHTDPHYNPTILHVVYQGSSKPIFREDQTNILELELKGRVNPRVVNRYQSLNLAQSPIPCQGFWPGMSWDWSPGWWEALGRERLLEKSALLRKQLARVQYDWEQLLWEELLAMMGGPVNKAVFLDLAARLPYRVLRKAGNDPEVLEALVFGAGGWLGANPEGDPYLDSLQQHWSHLQHKFSLPDASPLPLRFSRMRPPQFPTFRLSQVARILSLWRPISQLVDPASWPLWLKQEIKTSAYWESHTRFGVESSAKARRLGPRQKEVMLLNVWIPLALAYQEAHGAMERQAEIWTWLGDLPAENNRITRRYAEMGPAPRNSAQSQGLIHLYKQFCLEKRCLHCRLGQQLLRPDVGLK